MASGGFKFIKLCVNLVLLAAILIGAWYGYNTFFVQSQATAEEASAIGAHIDNQEWDEALAKLDELEKNDKMPDFVKTSRHLCYLSIAKDAYDKADSDFNKASKYRNRYRSGNDPSDKKKADKYLGRSKKRYQKCLNALEQAEKYGELERVQVMNRSDSYFKLGNKEEAKRWQGELKNYSPGE